MKKVLLLALCCLFGLQAMAQADVSFTLSGLETDDHVSVTLSSTAYLATMDVTADGDYTFNSVPAGTHYLKVEAVGYNVPDSKAVKVNEDGTIDPATGISLVVTKMTDENSWAHSWHEDGSVSGYTTTSYINKPAEIVYLGKKIVPADVPSQSILQTDYHIVLSDDGEHWTQEYAYRLLETMKMFPEGIVGNDTLVIQLTADHIADDLTVEAVTGGKQVTLATDAFAYANPFLVTLDGVRGRFFSKRLHHAIVNLLTDYGNNLSKANQILLKRFGCTTTVYNYETLTAATTQETAESFQKFHPQELVQIINMFEEMPEGFHQVTNLKYLVRRLDGHQHPTHPQAAAVTWTQPNGYIEFMEDAFNMESTFEMQRLILHEKTHMLWEYTFSDELKNDWTELGGWYEDPNAPSGWSTTKTTEFVTQYAHDVTPNEDMAESVAYYIKDPDKLMSRSLPKYEFIRDRIMHGTRYISKIRDDLTFEVLNLFPDYDYPGKIKSLDISVTGAPEEDKYVSIKISLNHVEGLEDGAKDAFVRITSPEYIAADGTKKTQKYDVWLGSGGRDPYNLTGGFYLSKYSKSGYWTAGTIKVNDLQGNQRFEGENDFVWNMYVNNPLEELGPPVYESGSLQYNLTDTIVDGHEAQNLEVVYKCFAAAGMERVLAGLNSSAGTYTHQEYGTYDPQTNEAHINFLITEFYPTADYWVSFIYMGDNARATTTVQFSSASYHEPVQKIHIETAAPDTTPAELDLNRIFVYAEPVNKVAPDGETKVTINYYVRDDKSGLGHVYYTLRDPQGINHSEYHIHRNFYTDYFNGDPTVWERYTINIVLPKGSAPGIWGLSEMTLTDKALNQKKYSFVETLIFEPDDSQEDYVLFADLSDEDVLRFDLSALNDDMTGYSYVYRVISEETGQEISGTIDANGETANSRVRRAAAANSGYDVDVTDLPAGQLVVIIQVKDADGKVVAVRSKSVTKYPTYQLKLELAEGWNWISTNLRNENLQGSTQFISPIADQVQRLLSDTQELVNDDIYGLIGNLAELAPQNGYRIKVSEDVSHTWAGKTFAPAEVPITLYKGWNWIGFVPTEEMSVEDAMASLTPAEDDRIISHNEGFSTYSNGKWMGTLTLKPGQSYQYHAGANATFTYPDNAVAASRMMHTPAANNEDTPWPVNAHQYPDNTTIIASLLVDDMSVTDGYTIGAFCGEECRGVAQWVNGLLFITVHGTISNDETITFMASDGIDMLPIQEQLHFEGQALGSVSAPMLLHVDTTITGISDREWAADTRDNDAYSLTGQKVSTLRRGGIYIVGGKKVAIYSTSR